jgi:hypothetical protein
VIEKVLEYYGIEIEQELPDGEVMCFCPFHDDRNTPNLRVNLDEDLFHCWACGAGGRSFVSFVMLMEQIDDPKIARLYAERRIFQSFNVQQLRHRYERLSERGEGDTSFLLAGKFRLLRSRMFREIQESLEQGFKVLFPEASYYFYLKGQVARHRPEMFFQVYDTDLENKIQYFDYLSDYIMERFYRRRTIEGLWEFYRRFKIFLKNP